MLDEAFLAGFQKEAQERTLRRDIAEAAGETALEEAGGAAIGAVGGGEAVRRLGDSKIFPKINAPDFMKGRPARMGGRFVGALTSGLIVKSLIDQVQGQE